MDGEDKTCNLEITRIRYALIAYYLSHVPNDYQLLD